MFEKLHLRNFQTRGMRCVRKRLLQKYSNYSFKCGNIQRWILNIHFLLLLAQRLKRMTRRKTFHRLHDTVTLLTVRHFKIHDKDDLSSGPEEHSQLGHSWKWQIAQAQDTRTRLIFFCFCPRVNIKSLKGNVCAPFRCPPIHKSTFPLFFWQFR